MKKIFTFFLGALMCTSLMAQNTNNEAVIQKVGDVVPVIDGTIDDVWADVTQNNIIRPFGTEVPTMGAEGETYYKMLWSDAGLYILIVANDDVWYPYTGTGDAYTFDKIELYFDTNDILDDAVGGQGGTSGNRQVAPDPKLSALDGTMQTTTQLGGDYNWAYKLNDPAWTTEWFIPWECIPNKDGLNFATTGTMGFDVDVTDNDNDGVGRKRLMWSNDATFGANNENWNNMDAAGRVTFEGAEELIAIDDITISGGAAITTDNGTVQLSAVVAPADANQKYIWKVDSGADLAKVDKDGLVTAIKSDGTVTVRAYSADLFVMSNEVTITITGQKVTSGEINLLKNGNFELGDTGLESWGVNPAASWSVTDGWLTAAAAPVVNMWDIMAYQAIKIADATTKYIVKFKAKGSVDMVIPFILEDTSNNYNKALTSSSPMRATDYWNIPVTTNEQWFEFDVIFSAKVDNSTYQPSWQVGLNDGTFSVDSVMIYSEADGALLSTSTKEIAKNAMHIYPNPIDVNNVLNVTLPSAGMKVAIYNAIGQKMMEQLSTSNLVKFNVGSLTKGMYIVRLENGITQKFIR